MNGDTTVYATRRRPSVVHTNEDCPLLGPSKGYREVTRRTYPNKDICAYCSGDVDHTGHENPIYKTTNGDERDRRTPMSTTDKRVSTVREVDPERCPWPDCSGPVRQRSGRREERCYECNRRPEDAPDPDDDTPLWAQV